MKEKIKDGDFSKQKKIISNYVISNLNSNLKNRCVDFFKSSKKHSFEYGLGGILILGGLNLETYPCFNLEHITNSPTNYSKSFKDFKREGFKNLNFRGNDFGNSILFSKNLENNFKGLKSSYDLTFNYRNNWDKLEMVNNLNSAESFKKTLFLLGGLNLIGFSLYGSLKEKGNKESRKKNKKIINDYLSNISKTTHLNNEITWDYLSNSAKNGVSINNFIKRLDSIYQLKD